MEIYTILMAKVLKNDVQSIFHNNSNKILKRN